MLNLIKMNVNIYRVQNFVLFYRTRLDENFSAKMCLLLEVLDKIKNIIIQNSYTDMF